MISPGSWLHSQNFIFLPPKPKSSSSSSFCCSKNMKADAGSSTSFAFSLSVSKSFGAIKNHLLLPWTRPSEKGMDSCLSCSPLPAGPKVKKLEDDFCKFALRSTLSDTSDWRSAAFAANHSRPGSICCSHASSPATPFSKTLKTVVLLARRAAATVCSQCSVSAPPFFLKSGLALRLKQFMKYFSMVTKLYSYCSSSGTLDCCLSKDRFSLAFTGYRYLICISVLVNRFSEVNILLIMSKDFMPPVMMKGLRRSTFPFLSRETRSLAGYFLILHFFAPSPFRALTPISLSVSEVGTGAVPCFLASAAASSSCRRAKSLSAKSTLSLAARMNMIVFCDIFFSSAKARSSFVSANARSNSSF
mmetsp:Transcript_38210/g.120329  ORF Transcript_38210/g.120329 Transcript_38210/m.120329 type:complete len:360 (+) Transcript_38210:567-1646(+)